MLSDTFLSDQRVRFTWFYAQKHCPYLLRRVVVWDKDKEQELVLLTNHLAFAATTIPAILKD